MIKHTVYRDDEEVILTVDFDYSPPDRGRREHGIQMEPDSPEEIEIISAKDVNGKDIKLTEAEEIEITNAISQDIRERRDDAAIARYMLYHWICTSGFEAFEEELEIIEAGKVDAIPDDQLPLHSIHEFEYRANKTRFEERLKEGNKHEKRRPERAVQKMAIQRRAAVYRLREYREGNKVPRR